MKAAYFEKHGDLDEITIGDLEAPRIRANEVLVETRYAALNHLDYFVTKGWPGLNLTLPHVLGSDGAGLVKEVGSLVTRVKVGDRVTFNPGLSCGKCHSCLSGEQNLCKEFSIMGEHQRGTYAEYFKVPEINVLKIPDGFPIEEAAAAPLTFLTAWRMLATRARVKQGDTVFIHGAGGGVSTAAIQIAKVFGATVITSTSTAEKVEKAKELGADHVINYKEMPDYSKHVFKNLTGKKGVDIVVDSVGSATFPTSVRMLKPDGKLVTCGATTGPKCELDIRHVFWRQLQIIGSTMSNQGEFRDVMALVFAGKLKPVTDRVFPLEKVKDAEKHLVSANQFGKVLLKI